MNERLRIATERLKKVSTEFVEALNEFNQAKCLDGKNENKNG